MKRNIKSVLFFFLLLQGLYAKENANIFRTVIPQNPNQVFAGCEPSKSNIDLNVNKVKCRIWINGDMWWDLEGTALYEVPVGSGKNSMFAGAIWIGGKDDAGNLKVAAQTYRQSGSDFWPGPIDTISTSIGAQTCLKYDKHFKITKAEVKNFHEAFQNTTNPDPNYPIPDVIKNWPGNGDVNAPFNQALQLAPFYDRAGDGIYNYNDGDYPKYNIDGTLDPCDKNLLLGDQTIWWVFNDVGNIHGETASTLPIGVEIQAQAFGFNTNDEINNMTFYRYKIINRASSILNETYFGSWVDPDLGNYLDDFVGCDVMRGLGFCYNGDADDDGAVGYGVNPPAIGMDFFEGPTADANDGKDNDRDGVTDEPGEQIIMSKFVYYNNDGTNIGNPDNALQYYNYLDGKWKDNSPLVYGGTGYQSGGPLCDFMFPGNSDPDNIGTGGNDPGFEWSENLPCPTCTPNEPSDRRFLQSAGKFTLVPGAINFITTGVVWARTSSGGPDASVKLLKIADVKAQNLFESCFKILEGPDAPELKLRELDKEIIISIENPEGSNNYKELYTEKDINIPSNPNAIFTFEGYKVFQVKDPSVSINDLHNPDKARIIPQGQSDILNGLSQIVNKSLDGDLNAYVPIEEVVGADKGLKHSFRVTTDLFATGDPGLVNHKTYYFLAVAYANDSVADILDPFEPPGPGLYGQPYIQSRKSGDGTAVKVYTAIPHISAPEAGGLELTTTFGDGPEITRITGIGNGFVRGSERGTLDLKQEQIDNILFNQSNPTNRILNPVYVKGRGPVDIRIYDPMKVTPAEFELWLTDTTVKYGFAAALTFDTVITPADTVINPPDTIITAADTAFIPINTLNVPGPIYSIRIGQVLTSNFNGFVDGTYITQITGTGPYVITLSAPLTITDTPLVRNESFKILADSRWILRNNTTGKIDTSTKTLEFPYDQLFPDYGFYISMNQIKSPGEFPSGGNGAIEGTLEFNNPSKPWVGFIPDIDNSDPLNWILSGTSTEADNKDYQNIDGSQFYEKILNGGWAPFRLVSRNPAGGDYIAPAPLLSAPQPNDLDSLFYLGSVDVVMTSDKSKWSKCVVFEMGNTSSQNEGGQGKNLLRRHPSWNMDGTYSTTDSGYSWFPGYAINIETGERLNIAFGEDSYLSNDNGNDMIWNPSSNVIDNNFNLFAGGKHYIYVFSHKIPEQPKGIQDTSYYGPAYDSCNFIHGKLQGFTPNSNVTQLRARMRAAWKDCMWVSVPILIPGQSLLSNQARVRLRVSKPYRAYDTGFTGTFNNNFPYYKFGTADLSPRINQPEVAKSALSLINVVPNPYYAYSNYETNQLDNRIKIVNLPSKCEISIFTTSGTLIRRFKRDAGGNSNYNNSEGAEYPDVNLESSVDWDMKNSAGIPIASGIYLIHIKVDGVGERTLKWFGVLRPIDLDTF